MNKLQSIIARAGVLRVGRARFATAKGEVSKHVLGDKQRDDAITYYEDGQLKVRSGIVLRKQEQIEEYVFKMLREYFKTTNKAGLSLESSLKEHGIDSLDTIELAMRLEEDLGYRIATENLPIFHKVKHFVNFIQQTENFKQTYNRAPLA